MPWIYAFGLILSDMLLGSRTTADGNRAIEELRERMEHAPRPLRSVDPTIPEAVERIVSRCVDPDPAARFQTTAELVAALDRLGANGVPLPLARRVTRRLLIGALALFLVGEGVTWWLARGPAPEVAHEPVSVLIADFQNGTNDPTFDRTLEPMLKLALEGASFMAQAWRLRRGTCAGSRMLRSTSRKPSGIWMA